MSTSKAAYTALSTDDHEADTNGNNLAGSSLQASRSEGALEHCSEASEPHSELWTRVQRTITHPLIQDHGMISLATITAFNSPNLTADVRLQSLISIASLATAYAVHGYRLHMGSAASLSDQERSHMRTWDALAGVWNAAGVGIATFQPDQAWLAIPMFEAGAGAVLVAVTMVNSGDETAPDETELAELGGRAV